MFAIFHISSKSTVFTELLKMIVDDSTTTSDSSFNIVGEIPSGPGDIYFQSLQLFSQQFIINSQAI